MLLKTCLLTYAPSSGEEAGGTNASDCSLTASAQTSSSSLLPFPSTEGTDANTLPTWRARIKLSFDEDALGSFIASSTTDCSLTGSLSLFVLLPSSVSLPLFVLLASSDVEFADTTEVAHTSDPTMSASATYAFDEDVSSRVASATDVLDGDADAAADTLLSTSSQLAPPPLSTMFNTNCRKRLLVI